MDSIDAFSKFIDSPNQLSRWILLRIPNISNLKLQKLMFYSYGVISAFDLESELSGVQFEAWKYGPVERSTYHSYSKFGSSFIPTYGLDDKFDYSSELQAKLLVALKIYGSLGPIDLVRQSHLEKPWVEAWRSGKSQMDMESIKKHFKDKYCTGRVSFPEVIFDSGFLAIDHIPHKTFSSIEEMAIALQA